MPDKLVLAIPGDQPIDLSQAHSLYDTGGNQVIGEKKDPAMDGIERALARLLSNLTASTNKVLDKQTDILTEVIKNAKSLEEAVQSALNDIDVRLSKLSQQQALIETVVDSMIKLWLLGATQEGMDAHMAILQDFIKRGNPDSFVLDTNATSPQV